MVETFPQQQQAPQNLSSQRGTQHNPSNQGLGRLGLGLGLETGSVTGTVERVDSSVPSIDPIPARIGDQNRNPAELVVGSQEAAVRQAVIDSTTELSGKLATIHISTAEALLCQALYADAVPHLESAVKMVPDSSDYANQLGYVLYLAGDDATALGVFERVLTREPQNVDALYNVGMISFGVSDFATAEASFRACTQLDPQNAEVWNNLGVILFQSSSPAEARRCFEQALTIEPQNADAIDNLQNM